MKERKTLKKFYLQHKTAILVIIAIILWIIGVIVSFNFIFKPYLEDTVLAVMYSILAGLVFAVGVFWAVAFILDI